MPLLPPYLNPKNILLIILGGALLFVGTLYLFQRTELHDTEASLKATQKDLATQTKNLTDCRKNVSAVNTQYTKAEKVNQQTGQVKDQIWSIVNRPPRPTQAASNQTVNLTKEMVIDYETQKKLDDLFAVANNLIVDFNNSMQPLPPSKK